MGSVRASDSSLSAGGSAADGSRAGGSGSWACSGTDSK